MKQRHVFDGNSQYTYIYVAAKDQYPMTAPPPLGSAHFVFFRSLVFDMEISKFWSILAVNNI